MVILYVDLLRDRIITCIVTSGAKDKNKTLGCHFKTQRFFVNESQKIFDRDTYIELLRLREWKYTEFEAEIGKTVNFKFCIPKQVMEEIKKCLKKLQKDIPLEYLSIIE